MKKRTLDLGIQHRTLQLSRDSVDENTRTVEMSFSSESPVLRWFGHEILDHDERSVDLSRLRAAGPLLEQHDTDRQVGVVENVRINNRRGAAVVRFGKGARASELFADVIDGIRRNVSVGYRIHELTQTDAGDPEKGIEPTYRATHWEPVELSLVSVPADISVGVGRSDEKTNTCMVVEMENEKTAPAPAEKKAEQPVVRNDELDRMRREESERLTAKTRKDAQEGERSRIAGLLEIGDAHDASDLAREFVRQGKSVDELRAAILERLGKMEKAPSPEIGLSQREAKQYSFVRAIHALANPQDKRAQQRAAFEWDVSNAAVERYGKDTNGMRIPHDVLVAPYRRDLVVGTAATAGDLVGTDHLGDSFIEHLRNRSVVMELGARRLDDLMGNVAIPRQDGGATAYWVAENVAPTESNLTVDQVTMSPKTVGAFTDISRKLSIQSSPSVEMLVRDDLSTVIALEIDRAALYGSGASNQPTGISATTGINTDTLTSANTPSWGETVDMESLVAADNADMGTLAYLTTPTIRGNMKTTSKDTGSGQFIWADNEVNGYRAMASNQVVAGDVWFGNWNDLLIGFWAGLDLLVDPYTGSAAGTIRIRVLQDCDIGVRHPVSFCLSNGGA